MLVFVVHDGSRGGDDVGGDAMRGEILLHVRVAVAPFPGGSIRAEDQHGNGGSGDADEGDNERYPPGDMRGETLLVDERIIDCWH